MKYFSLDAKKSKGFTVLELLVVLFIMTILLSIVLMSFTRGNKNTKNKVIVSEMRLVQIALEEYRAQCKVYPRSLDVHAQNTYPGTGSNCILEFGQLVPPDINLSEFNYVPLRSASTAIDVCTAYHISRELYLPSHYLDEDYDWHGDPQWKSCHAGQDVVSYQDVDGWYDIVYGILRI